MTELLKCSSCGGDIQDDVSFRQCPKCLLDLGLLRDPAPEGELSDTVLPAPARDFGGYQLLEQLGQGGMGTVFRARQLSLNRIVALKVMSRGGLGSIPALARFRREADAAAKLDHPNIVAIYEVGECEATPFLAMRLVAGGSLADRFNDFSAQEKKAVDLMVTVARAVHYAHERGVLHRDLKPSNILLDNGGNPHLTDFGIAKFLDQETDLTLTADLLGTPFYMSPEQASGKPLSVVSDIYSLGVVLYELLTGRRPFEADKPMDLLRKVIQDEPLHPRLLNNSVDPDLAVICLKCLDKNPSRRYSSSLELAQDLDRWRQDEPIKARPAGPILRARRWSARNPALATLICGLVIGIAITLALLAEARDEKNRKSLALAILRTETARQLQEIWESPKPFFEIKSEALAAMAGKEPGRLRMGEKRFTFGLLSEGNPLDRVLAAAPLLEELQTGMGAGERMPVRIDLRLYKTDQTAIADLTAGTLDFVQMNPRQYLLAQQRAPGIQPLVRLVPPADPGAILARSAVLFTRSNSGIKNISDLRGRSFLFGLSDSMATFWTKVHLVEAGVHAKNLSSFRYLDRLPGTRTNLSSNAEADLGNPFSEMTPVEAVLDGKFDAAVVTERRYRQVSAGENLVVLGQFPDAGLLVAGKAGLTPRSRTSFQQAMVHLKQPEVVQWLWGYSAAFQPCADAGLEELRRKLPAELQFETDPAESSNERAP